MPTTVSTMTLGDLQTYVKRQFGDESGVQITDADITRWANMGTLEIVIKNPFNEAYSDTNTVVAQREYSLSGITDLVKLLSVEYDSQYMLTATSFEGIKEILGTNQSQSGLPVYWYKFANSIFLWPAPSAVKNLRIYYVKSPAKVSAAIDKLPVPDRYYEQLCNFVMSKAYELDEDLPQSSAQRQMFEDKLVERANIDNSMSGSFPTVGDDIYIGFTAGPFNNDIDYGWW